MRVAPLCIKFFYPTPPKKPQNQKQIKKAATKYAWCCLCVYMYLYITKLERFSISHLKMVFRNMYQQWMETSGIWDVKLPSLLKAEIEVHGNSVSGYEKSYRHFG